jgi:uncharacterized protein (TIGR03083 family)
MSGHWHVAGQARNDFADMVEQLDDGQWATETLCPGWTPHDVLAHLVWHTELTVPSLLVAMVRWRFDFDHAAGRAAEELAKRPREQLLAELRSRADEKSSIPGAPESGSVTDTAIHTQDVRRALELPGALDAETVRTGLDFLTNHKNAKYLMDPSSITGLRLAATDIGWSSGTGPAVEGNGEALLMSLTGRPTLAELSGDGVELLATRLAS